MRHPDVVYEVGQDLGVEVVTDLERLAGLREEWDTLDADIPGAPSSRLEWVVAHARRLPTGETLRVVTVRSQGRLTGAAPLVQSGRLARRLRLVILSASGLRYADQTELRRLIDVLAALRLPLSLDLLVAESPTAQRLPRRLPPGHLIRVSNRLGGPSLALDASWSDPLSKVSKNRRRDFRRRRRRASEVGELRFEVHEPRDSAQLRSWFDAYVGIENLGWKAERGITFASDEARRAEYVEFLDGIRDEVVVPSLTIDGELAALEIGTISANRYWGHKFSFDPEFAQYSPGQLLTADILAWCVGRGLDRFEFSGTHEDYKAVWADGQPLRTLRTYPPSASGIAAAVTDGLAAAERRARRLIDAGTRWAPFARKRPVRSGADRGADGDHAAGERGDLDGQGEA